MYSTIQSRIPKQFAEFDQSKIIDPIYNVDDYAKEFKLRLQIAHKRAKTIVEQKRNSEVTPSTEYVIKTYTYTKNIHK